MMSLENYALLSSGLAIIMGWGLLAYYLPKVRSILGQKQETDNMMKDILFEINRRFTEQTTRLADQQVRLDVLEIRIKGVQNNPGRDDLKSNKNERLRSDILVAQDPLSQIRDLSSREKQVNVSQRRLGSTETQILTMLTKGSRTAVDLQKGIGKSREHTARLMKQLYEKGFVRRDDRSKPYLYEITGTGDSVVANA